MATTSTLNAIDLMKPANAGESTRLLLNVPHVPSSITLRPSVVCDTSLVLVEHTNMIRMANYIYSFSIVSIIYVKHHMCVCVGGRVRWVCDT